MEVGNRLGTRKNGKPRVLTKQERMPDGRSHGPAGSCPARRDGSAARSNVGMAFSGTDVPPSRVSSIRLRTGPGIRDACPGSQNPGRYVSGRRRAFRLTLASPSALSVPVSRRSGRPLPIGVRRRTPLPCWAVLLNERAAQAGRPKTQAGFRDCFFQARGIDRQECRPPSSPPFGRRTDPGPKFFGRLRGEKAYPVKRRASAGHASGDRVKYESWKERLYRYASAEWG
jgi:hypothetical protein